MLHRTTTLWAAAATAASAFLLFGCAREEAQEPSPAADGATASATNPPATGMPPGPMMGGGGGGGETLTPTPDLDKKIADLEKAGDKKALADAYAERGYKKMMDEAAGPRVKYRAALADFRLALAANPQNKKAKENKDTIENIYRGMGRPIPGEGE